MTTPKKFQFSNGFTLIEVLLFLLLVIAMTTILLSSLSSLVKTKGVNLEALAAKIASRQIETLRNTPFSSLPANGTQSFSDPDLSKLPAGTAAITMADFQGSSKIKQVAIEVNWQERDQPKQIQMMTLIYELGL